MRIQTLGLLLAVGMVVPSVASAGESRVAAVTINQAGTSASGSMRATRDNSSANDRIGCLVSAFEYSGGTVNYAACWAYQGTRSLTCSTTNAALIAAAGTVSESSYVEIRRLESNPLRCTAIEVENDSRDLP